MTYEEKLDFCPLFFTYTMFNSMFWNIKGISNKPSVRRVRKLIKMYKLSIFAILEPKTSNDGLHDYQRIFSCYGSYANTKGTIWVFLERKS